MLTNRIRTSSVPKIKPQAIQYLKRKFPSKPTNQSDPISLCLRLIIQQKHHNVPRWRTQLHRSGFLSHIKHNSR